MQQDFKVPHSICTIVAYNLEVGRMWYISTLVRAMSMSSSANGVTSTRDGSVFTVRK